MEEIWKDIKNYEGYYQISNYGNVRSLDRIDELGRLIKGREKVKQKQHYNKDNCYLNIILYKNGQKQRFYIHRLVAEAFIPNPENKPQVNHNDRNKKNNKIDNLEWVTISENIKYSYNFDDRKKSTGCHKIGKENIMSKKVKQYDLEGNFIKKWESARQASIQTNIDYSTIKQVCRGKGKKAGGYIWKYE